MSKIDGVQWFKNRKNRESYQVEEAKLAFSFAAKRQMERQQLTRRSLAAKLGKSAAYITKILGGDENLTIASMVRVARALDCDLHLHLAPKEHKGMWVDVIEGKRNAQTHKIDDGAKYWSQAC